MGEEQPQYITPDIDKRIHRRAKLVAQVRCEALSRQEVLVTRDVSVGGLFVGAKKPFPRDSEVAITFQLKSNGPSVSCRGHVAYSIAGVGMGIQFIDLSEENRQAIEKFIEEVA